MDRAPSHRLAAAAAALEMPLFADPPRTPAAGVALRFYVLILDGGASRPPPAPSPAGRPSADSFPPAVPPGMGGWHLLAIVARGKAMTRITGGGRWEGAEPNGITRAGLPGADTAR